MQKSRLAIEIKCEFTEVNENFIYKILYIE